MLALARLSELVRRAPWQFVVAWRVVQLGALLPDDLSEQVFWAPLLLVFELSEGRIFSQQRAAVRSYVGS